ncbi:sulfite exporter TauE/SafE family protein [Pontixanthobacter gangjinensis]|uniref:Probable membrane transporter protein n=1 Tax=Christiangramia aestuarii TaxID=1028746 RepID=A0A7K1LNU7_9FLAO|nr:sulfite exporter TauE/SafE family protein [Christiangramia aestuarii]MUP42484.1 sulfite exporter TauE/SafE family protein [Christiangramia aestuarii]
MDILEILGYFGALLIGLVLGLIGGGGSILTVPVLVYLMSINPVTATAYSLFIVGSSSLMGAGRNLQKGLVGFKTALAFAIPAVITVFSTRKFVVPALPEELFTIFGFTVTRDIGIMLFFAILMLFASVSMIYDKKELLEKQEKPKSANYLLLAPLGVLTGFITGIVGAGGGFIIIPILVLLAGLKMKKAVGTSLLIIAINSLLGFLGDLGHQEIDWIFLLVFTGISILGIFLGVYLNKFFDGGKLKKAFGWFVLIMGVYIIWSELY